MWFLFSITNSSLGVCSTKPSITSIFLSPGHQLIRHFFWNLPTSTTNNRMHKIEEGGRRVKRQKRILQEHIWCKIPTINKMVRNFFIWLLKSLLSNFEFEVRSIKFFLDFHRFFSEDQKYVLLLFCWRKKGENRIERMMMMSQFFLSSRSWVKLYGFSSLQTWTTTSSTRYTHTYHFGL